MATNPIPVAILVRVSTDEQDNTRQIEELQAVALERGWHVKEVVKEDGVSGSARNRPKLKHVLRLAEGNAISKLLVHEITRLSRHPAVLHDAVERCNEAGVSIYWHSQRTETLLADGERNPAAGMMLAILGEMGRTEREFLARRIKSGMASARQAGKHMGRPAGSGMSEAALLAKHSEIVKLLRAGQSIRHAAKITGKSKGTVETVKRMLGRRVPVDDPHGEHMSATVTPSSPIRTAWKWKPHRVRGLQPTNAISCGPIPSAQAG